ncbi:MAG: glycosyltransferase family A protein [Actinomycetota bacterium]|nr:glycosyltransferase family A protein [Actinomycetota bacterium]
MALVSVVMPVHRGGRYFEEAVRSVVAQSLADWELIVVDNNAQVDLTSVIRSDPRVRCVKEPNQGPSWARNSGAVAATAKHVAFLDEDDLWEPQKLERQIEAFSLYGNATFCYSGVLGVDADLNVVVRRPIRHLSYRDVVSDHGSVTTSSLMVNRDWFLCLGGYRPTLRYAEDVDLALRMLYSGTGIVVEEVLAKCRFHPDSYSHDYVRQAYDAMRVFSDNRKAAFASGEWDLWLQAWRGSLTVRHGYARHALSRGYHAHLAGRPWPEVAGHLATGVRMFPPSVVTMAAARMAKKGAVAPSHRLATWDPGRKVSQVSPDEIPITERRTDGGDENRVDDSAPRPGASQASRRQVPQRFAERGEDPVPVAPAEPRGLAASTDIAGLT